MLNAGAAYIFEYDSKAWGQQQIVAADAARYDGFGRSVAIQGDNPLVGSTGDDHGTILGADTVLRSGDPGSPVRSVLTVTRKSVS